MSGKQLIGGFRAVILPSSRLLPTSMSMPSRFALATKGNRQHIRIKVSVQKISFAISFEFSRYSVIQLNSPSIDIGSDGMNSPSIVGAEGNPKMPEYEFHC